MEHKFYFVIGKDHQVEEICSVLFKTANLELSVKFTCRLIHPHSNKLFTTNRCLSRERAATYTNEMLLTGIRKAKTGRQTTDAAEVINTEQGLGVYVCT